MLRFSAGFVHTTMERKAPRFVQKSSNLLPLWASDGGGLNWYCVLPKTVLTLFQQGA
jgi:hypothetical protein